MAGYTPEEYEMSQGFEGSDASVGSYEPAKGTAEWAGQNNSGVNVSGSRGDDGGEIGSGEPARGTAEWSEVNSGMNVVGSSVDDNGAAASYKPAKGTAEWAEQNSPVNMSGIAADDDKVVGSDKKVSETVDSGQTDGGVNRGAVPADVEVGNGGSHDGGSHDGGSHDGGSHDGGVVSASAGDGSENRYVVTDDMRREATAGHDAQIKAYQEYIDGLPKMETEEQRKKREKREKARRIIGAVSDGLRAMGNLYFTSQYAPNMYSEHGSMAKAVDDRIERLKRERERNRDAFLKYSIDLGKAKGDRAKTLRELEAEMERRKIAAEHAQREAELHPLNVAIKTEQGRKEKGLADKAATQADYAGRQEEADLKIKDEKAKTEKARQGSLNAAATNSYASAGEHKAKTNKIKNEDKGGFYVKDSQGHQRFIPDKEIEQEFAKLPEERRKSSGGRTRTGFNPATKEQQKKAIAEYERELTHITSDGNDAGKETMPGVKPSGNGGGAKMPGVK